MPQILPTYGYDPLFNYSVDELVQMYVKEGVDTRDALERAQLVSRGISAMNKAEQRLWKKVREYEVPVGTLDDLARVSDNLGAK